ncbi:coiled-coil domain-containing protein 15 [Rhynchocyon petersi]
MAPLKKPGSAPGLLLALNPLKSKDVLKVLAERNQIVVPVGAWVEPASAESLETPAYTSAYAIEEELKDHLRKKEAALKHFQRQVRHRVCQHNKLRKKLQRSSEAAEKEDCITMHSSDPTPLVLKRTSIFPNNVNAAIGSSGLPLSPDEEENQNEFFHQQAQALSQTMKQIRDQLASFKIVGEKKIPMLSGGKKDIIPIQENMFLNQPSSFLREERVKQEFHQQNHQYVTPKTQDQAFSREQKPEQITVSQKAEGTYLSIVKHEGDKNKQSLKFRNWNKCSMNQRNYDSCDMTDKRLRKEFFPDYYEYALYEIQDPGSARKQLFDTHLSRSNTKFKAPLVLQSGVDNEEDKKRHQKQYLRHKRLFMDTEREQVKEQQRQNEHKKKIEKIKKKKEEERFAEEQRILRTTSHDELPSGEKISEILTQLQLEEIKRERERQKQREKENIRYIEALKAQIQKKVQLYNITLPPLCCCGPEFWDAHPDTCANNCIFYKNQRAYSRALHSVMSSCDIPEGNSALRIAIHNFTSLHRRALKTLK